MPELISLSLMAELAPCSKDLAVLSPSIVCGLTMKVLYRLLRDVRIRRRAVLQDLVFRLTVQYERYFHSKDVRIMVIKYQYG